MARQTFPLWIRDEKPDGRNWQRLTGERIDGLPDGFHTGGAWLDPESDLVYKPLDGRPYANSEIHTATDELEANCAMAAITGQRNWWTETTSHTRDDETIERRWLVRKRAFVLGQGDWKVRDIKLEQVLQVEQTIRAFNEAWWEIGDDISVAFDLQSYEVFILDLSTAFYRPGATGCYIPDDWWRVQKWLGQLGFENLLNLRKYGKRVAPLPCGDKFLNRGTLGEVEWPGREWVHVYASRNRPMSAVWARIDKAHYVQSDYRETGVHTWVVTPEPLDDDTLYKFELTWAWSPLHHRDHRKPGARGTAPAWKRIVDEEERNRS